jgi:large subunit ribosomal protein L10
MPSQKILEQKQEVVRVLSEKMRNAASGVLVKYEGITVEDDTKLRAALRAAGVEYSVMKNSLTGRACEEAGYGDMKQYLTGMTAIAISEKDPVAPAKIMKEYSDKIKSFEIKAGFVDGAVVDASVVMTLATIPSKEQLIAKMLGSLMSPLYGFAYALQAIIDKDGEPAPAEAEEAPAAEEVSAEA